MIKLFSFLIFCGLLFAPGAQAQDSVSAAKVEEITRRIRQKYTPDARSARFEAKWREDGAVIEVESTDSNALSDFETQLREHHIGATVRSEMLPSSQLNGKIYGVANLSVCNHRTSPANMAEMATQMLLGTPVQVLKKERGYYLVRTPDGYLSWTDDDGVAPLDAAGFHNWQRSEKVVFVADYGHSFVAPSTKATRISDLVSGNILQLLRKSGKWVHVRYPDGRTAYIPTKQTMPYGRWSARKNPKAEQIITTAKTLLGIPYLWGGTSSKGVDCSGFIKTAFFLNGIVLPRDASQQALIGEEIDIRAEGMINLAQCLKNLVPGDLLFFGSPKQPNVAPRVSHTALYLGNGEFIQAAGQVRINSMLTSAPNYDDVRTKTLIGARRVLNHVGTAQITRVDQHPSYVEPTKH